MLAISPKASEAITAALERVAVPESAGLRLTAGPQTSDGTAVNIAFVTAPEPDDHVIETDAAADVFVAPAAAELLDDQVLDADVASDGAIRFALHSQTSTDGRWESAPASDD